MKTLNEILNESLLDADFDVSVEDIYADNIVNKLTEIASVHKLKDHDKTVKELYNLLREAARKRQEQNTSSILRRLRMKDNTSVYMFSSNSNKVIIFIRRFVRGSLPYMLKLELFHRDDGSSRVYMFDYMQVKHMGNVTPSMKETLVFLGPEVWDNLLMVQKNR